MGSNRARRRPMSPDSACSTTTNHGSEGNVDRNAANSNDSVEVVVLAADGLTVALVLA
jgi:hypothetical protein